MLKKLFPLTIIFVTSITCSAQLQNQEKRNQRIAQTLAQIAGPVPCTQIYKKQCKHEPHKLTITPDGTKLVTSYYLGWGAWVPQLDIFDIDGIKLAQCGSGGWTKGTFKLRITKDSKKIVYAHADIQILDMHGNKLAEWGYKEGHLSALELIDDMILLGCDDGQVYAWDMQGNELFTCKGHRDAITSIQALSNGNIVTCSDDRTLRIWDRKGNQVAVYDSIWHSIDLIGISNDGTNIITAHSDNTIRIFDMECNLVTKWATDTTRHMEAACIGSDNSIVAAYWDDIIRIWDTEGNLRAQCIGHKGTVYKVCATNNNKIISCGADGTIRVWNMQGNQLAQCTESESIYSFCVTPDGNKVIADVGKTICVWDLALINALDNLTEKQAQTIWQYLQKENSKKSVNAKKVWRFVKHTLDVQ